MKYKNLAIIAVLCMSINSCRDGTAFHNGWRKFSIDEHHRLLSTVKYFRMPANQEGDFPWIYERYGMCDQDAFLVFHASDEWVQDFTNKYNIRKSKPKDSDVRTSPQLDILEKEDSRYIPHEDIDFFMFYKTIGDPKLNKLISSGHWIRYDATPAEYVSRNRERLLMITMIFDPIQQIVVCNLLFQ